MPEEPDGQLELIDPWQCGRDPWLTAHRCTQTTEPIESTQNSPTEVMELPLPLSQRLQGLNGPSLEGLGAARRARGSAATAATAAEDEQRTPVTAGPGTAVVGQLKALVEWQQRRGGHGDG